MTAQSKLEKCKFCPCVPRDMHSIELCQALVDYFAAREQTVPAPVWTDEIPKEPGAYWWREDDKSKCVLTTIKIIDMCECVLWTNAPGHYQPVWTAGGQWSTRIPGPREKS